MDDPLIYGEELNTQLFNENFEVEVFKVVSGSVTDTFQRKYFLREENPVIDGFLTELDSRSKETVGIAGTIVPAQPTPNLVSYYFDLVKDHDIDQAVACKGAEVFNKSSYYIDLEFDCEPAESDESIIIDIYGRVTESEICQT